MAKYYCKYCGRSYPSVNSLAAAGCQRHPAGPYKGKCVLYEGAEKKEYVCKYCGQKFSSLTNLTGGACRRHPNGPYKGKHSPAL